MTDSGSGIPDEIRGRIFEPFFSTRPHGEGAGLGLDVVKKIVAKHQGRIDVQTTLGVGSQFSIYLPLTSADTDAYLRGVKQISSGTHGPSVVH